MSTASSSAKYATMRPDLLRHLASLRSSSRRAGSASSRRCGSARRVRGKLPVGRERARNSIQGPARAGAPRRGDGTVFSQDGADSPSYSGAGQWAADCAGAPSGSERGGRIAVAKPTDHAANSATLQTARLGVGSASSSSIWASSAVARRRSRSALESPGRQRGREEAPRARDARRARSRERSRARPIWGIAGCARRCSDGPPRVGGGVAPLARASISGGAPSTTGGRAWRAMPPSNTARAARTLTRWRSRRTTRLRIRAHRQRDDTRQRNGTTRERELRHSRQEPAPSRNRSSSAGRMALGSCATDEAGSQAVTTMAAQRNEGTVKCGRNRASRSRLRSCGRRRMRRAILALGVAIGHSKRCRGRRTETAPPQKGLSPPRRRRGWGLHSRQRRACHGVDAAEVRLRHSSASSFDLGRHPLPGGARARRSGGHRAGTAS